MSGSNAISCITLVGAIIAVGYEKAVAQAQYALRELSKGGQGTLVCTSCY